MHAPSYILNKIQVYPINERLDLVQCTVTGCVWQKNKKKIKTVTGYNMWMACQSQQQMNYTWDHDFSLKFKYSVISKYLKSLRHRADTPPLNGQTTHRQAHPILYHIIDWERSHMYMYIHVSSCHRGSPCTPLPKPRNQIPAINEF